MRPGTGAFVMTITLVVLGFYLLYPMVLVLTMSFNTARDVLVPPAIWGFGNWLTAWDDPLLLQSLFNSFLIWFLIAGISFPIAITISLILSRTRIPFSYGLEFGFWVAFMFPGLSTTIGWMMLLDPDVGMINTALVALPFIDEAPFNIFSLPGIIWVKLMGDGIAYKVMLLTPAFRNMDGALEEAARTSGASAVATMFRVTLPVGGEAAAKPVLPQVPVEQRDAPAQAPQPVDSTTARQDEAALTDTSAPVGSNQQG